jgi:hypothetical protein
MSPTLDERIASVIRALTGVVLPSLAPEASLAQEQLQLCVGHLQILRAQLDEAPAFEAQELRDAVALGARLVKSSGGPLTRAAVAEVRAALDAAGCAHGPAGVREVRIELHAAIAALVKAVAADGDDAATRTVPQAIVAMERERILLDRRWFAPFGFDSEIASA